jgi:hypothetical protein
VEAEASFCHSLTNYAPHNCDGVSVWWSGAHNYKNAITNHLYLHASAVGYLRKKDQKYLDNAKKVNYLFISCLYRSKISLLDVGLVYVSFHDVFALVSYPYPVKKSGMRNSDGLWNDGLNPDCKNNGQVRKVHFFLANHSLTGP